MSWPWPFKQKEESVGFRYKVVLPYETIPENTMLYRAAPTVEEHPTPRECTETLKVGVYFSMNHPYLAETMIAEKQFDMPIAVYKTTKPLKVVVGKYTIRCRACREAERVIRQIRGDRNVILNLDELQNEAHVDHDVLPLLDATVKPEAPFAELFLTKKELPHVKYLGCYFRTQQEIEQIWYPEIHPGSS